MRTRLGLAMGSVVALMLAIVPTVSEAPADAEHGTQPISFTDIPIDGVCPFTFRLSAQGTTVYNVVFTANGVRTGLDFMTTETDTLVGPNNVPLVSRPYTSKEHITFDAAGNGHDFVTGNIATFILPDGSVFMSAGRVTSVGGYVIVPDFGRAGNVNALCAALD